MKLIKRKIIYHGTHILWESQRTISNEVKINTEMEHIMWIINIISKQDLWAPSLKIIEIPWDREGAS